MMQKQDWDKYLVIFTKIWNINTARSRMDHDASLQLNLSSGNQNWAGRVKRGANQIQRAQPQSQHFAQPQQSTRQDTRSDLPRHHLQELALQDKVLRCVNCGSNFIFSVSSQNHHSEMGWQTLPSKGPCYRDWEQLKCSLFDQFGDCRFGATCRYSHNKPQSSSVDSIVTTKRTVSQTSLLDQLSQYAIEFQIVHLEIAVCSNTLAENSTKNRRLK